MENKNSQKTISKVIYGILILIILVLGGFLIWSSYIYDLYKEYETPYKENCYKVEYDNSSITYINYYASGDILYTTQKQYFENGKMLPMLKCTDYCRSKEAAKKIYENKSRYNNKTVKLVGKNMVEYEYEITDDTDEIYYTEEDKKVMNSFTKNEDIINYLIEKGEKNNFGNSDEWKRVK